MVVGGLFLVARAVLGERALTTSFASAVHAPIQLRDEIVSVRAQSSAARPLDLPYAGELQLEVTVVKGKHVNVFVVDASDWAEFAAAKEAFFGGKFRHYPQFHATETIHTKIAGKLPAGSYYVVLDNPTYGILVESSFDVQLKAELRP